jgi:hypothetical protein
MAFAAKVDLHGDAPSGTTVVTETPCIFGANILGKGLANLIFFSGVLWKQ